VARSFRTQQPAALAARRMARDEEGKPELPRIIIRRPKRGDRNPFTTRSLTNMLRSEVPLEYLHGLTRIELRARPGEVGEPFAYYIRDEKAIVIHSLPLQWSWDYLPPRSLVKSMTRFYADFELTEDSVRVTWPSMEVLSLWMFVHVLAHELGHHYRTQYRIRRGSWKHRRHEELVADLHSARFLDRFTKKMKERAAKG
jgi:hypothetical protein